MRPVAPDLFTPPDAVIISFARVKVRKLAIANGCRPIYAEGIFGNAWHCGCPDLFHAADSQCSVLTPTSAARRRA